MTLHTDTAKPERLELLGCTVRWSSPTAAPNHRDSAYRSTRENPHEYIDVVSLVVELTLRNIPSSTDGSTQDIRFQVSAVGEPIIGMVYVTADGHGFIARLPSAP